MATENQFKCIDMQYFQESDTLLVHNLDAKGNKFLTTVEKPKLKFGVLKEGIEPDFFTPIENVDIYTCSYKNRLREIAVNVFGYTQKEVNAECKKNYTRFKNEICNNPLLFMSDTNVSFYYKYKLSKEPNYNDVIMPKIFSFDIEVHTDFKLSVLEELQLIEKSESLEEFKKNAKINYKEFKGYFEYERVIDNLSIDFFKEPNKVNDILRLLHSEHCIQDDYKALREYIPEYYTEFYSDNISFPHAEKAYSRIDTITGIDNVTGKFYIYFLRDEYDIQESFLEQIADGSFTVEAKEFLNLFALKIFLNNYNDVVKGHPELLKSVNDIFIEFADTSFENVKDKLYAILKDVAEVIGQDKIDQICRLDVEFVCFDDEFDLIASFFTKLKEINPSFVLAYNTKFDFLTLYNRLRLKYNLYPEYFFNHFGPFYTDDNLDVRITEDSEDPEYLMSYRIDEKAQTAKKDKTNFKVAGVVWLDAMLLTAKTTQRERDFSLEGVAKDYLKEGKFKFKGSITTLYETDTRQFCLYAGIDTFLVHQLNATLSLVDQFQRVVDRTNSTWADHTFKSTYITNNIRTYQLDDGFFTQSNQRVHDHREHEKFEGALILLSVH